MKKPLTIDTTRPTRNDDILETALDLKALRRLAVRTNLRAGYDKKNETDEEIG